MTSDSYFEEAVDALCAANLGLGALRDAARFGHPLPSRDAVIDMVQDLRSVFFPGYFGATKINKENLRLHVGSTLDRVRTNLETQILRGMCFVCLEDCGGCRPADFEASARSKMRDFISQLPEVRRMLASDVQAHFTGDPAATSPDEAVFCYPGVLAIMYFRIAHELFKLEVPLIPRMITEFAHSITGIDIHPGAVIGENCMIDHGTGVVVGETSIIGDRVRIYQGVTLGAKSFPLDKDGKPIKGVARHPIVEDDVVIYSGATILGRVTIGKGSVIGGNVWLTRSIPAGSRISQARAKQPPKTAA